MKRDKTIDTFKSILIILVVLGHVFQTSTSDDGGLIMNFIWAIQMPGFMLISGYLSDKPTDNFLQLRLRLLKYFSRYFVPFISWHIFVSTFLLKRYDTFQDSIWRLMNNVDLGLWFLWVLFVISIINSIIGYFLKRNVKENRIYLLIFILLFSVSLVYFIFITKLSLDFLGIKLILFYSIYFYAGVFFKKYHAKFLNVRHKTIIHQLTSVIPLFIFFFLMLNYDLYRASDSFGWLLIRIIAGMLGNYSLFLIVMNADFEKEMMSRLGKYTLEIYSVHIYVCSTMKIDSGFSLFSINGILNFSFSLIITIVLSFLLIITIKSFPLLNQLMFGKKEKYENLAS